MFSRDLLCFSSSLHLITYVHLQCNAQISQEYCNLSASQLKFLKFTHKNHVYLMSKQETAVSLETWDRVHNNAPLISDPSHHPPPPSLCPVSSPGTNSFLQDCDCDIKLTEKSVLFVTFLTFLSFIVPVLFPRDWRHSCELHLLTVRMI